MNDTVASRGMSQQVGDLRPADLAAGLFERIHALEFLPRWPLGKLVQRITVC